MPDMVERLLADGLLRRDDSRLRTTRRWQAAMARAALRLLRAGTDGDDLRVPMIAALLDLYEGGLDDAGVVDALAVMLPIEVDELAPPAR